MLPVLSPDSKNFLPAGSGLSIGERACLTKAFSYDYIQCPSEWPVPPGEETELVSSASVMKQHHIPGQCIRKHRGINAEQLDSNGLVCSLKAASTNKALVEKKKRRQGKACCLQHVWMKFTCGVFISQFNSTGHSGSVRAYSSAPSSGDRRHQRFISMVLFTRCQHTTGIAVSEILLLQFLYGSFGNGMCFIIHVSLKIKLQP